MAEATTPGGTDSLTGAIGGGFALLLVLGCIFGSGSTIFIGFLILAAMLAIPAVMTASIKAKYAPRIAEGNRIVAECNAELERLKQRREMREMVEERQCFLDQARLYAKGIQEVSRLQMQLLEAIEKAKGNQFAVASLVSTSSPSSPTTESFLDGLPDNLSDPKDSTSSDNSSEKEVDDEKGKNPNEGSNQK